MRAASTTVVGETTTLRVTRNVVVSPTTVVDAARIQRARMLGELCYTIPGSSLPADKRRAERFATQYLGVAA